MSLAQESFGKTEFFARKLLSLREIIFKTVQSAIGALDLGTKTSLRYRLLGFAFLLAISVFFIPATFFKQPNFGLDPSWRLLLNKAFSESWGFGSQLVWTYGPLGIFESRIPYGVNRFCYLAYDLLVLFLFLCLTVDVIKTHLDSKLLLGCIIALACVKDLVSSLPSTALYCLVIFLIVRNLSRPGVLTSIALVLASGVMLLFKINFGLVGIFLSCAILICRQVEGNKQAYLWLAIAVSQIVVAILVAAHFGTNLFQYVSGSLDLVRQYNDGMSAGPGKGAIPHFAICLIFAAYLLMSAAFVRRHVFRDFVYLLVSGVAIFVLFKTAIVRSDYLPHNRCFLLGFPLLALIFFIHGPETIRKLWRVLFLGSAFYAGLLLVVEHGNCLIYMQRDCFESFLPIDYFRRFANYDLNRDWHSYTNFVRKSSPERCIPDDVKRLIGDEAVDVFPYEASLPLGSGLNYQSRPVPQSYAVLGPRLEGRNEAFFQSARAPRFVLYVMGQKSGSIDDRYALWDEPALKRTIQTEYGCQLVFTNLLGSDLDPPICASPIMLLQKKPAPTAWQPVSLLAKTEMASSDFLVPEYPNELYAKLMIRKTLLGKIFSLFYRGGRAYARFELEDGSAKKFRIIPANLQNGVLVNYFADGRDIDGLRNYFCNHSRGNAKCRKLRIEFEHPWEYKSRFDVSYFNLSAPQETRSRAVEPQHE
jgi:hypothetical protein